MYSRSYECIVPKVATDIRLDDLPADPISINKVLILTLRAPLFLISMASSHCVQGAKITRGLKIIVEKIIIIISPTGLSGHQEIRGCQGQPKSGRVEDRVTVM